MIFILVPVCQLQFERTTLFTSVSNFYAASICLGDFNNDNQLDISFITAPLFRYSDDMDPR